jgi:PPK2 family polyphosphate:nucleotide phosphotransferase
LRDVDPSDTGDFEADSRGEEEVREKTRKILSKLDDHQERLYASADRSLLLVFQGIDTAGKDGVIKHVMSGVDPQGCRVSSFKAPNDEEKAHDFLWRIHKAVPPKGFIGIFNRSHYEDVLYPRIHKLIGDKTVARRFSQINDFEKHLVQNGTTILKFFLFISKEEQRQRLQDRADDPHKRWKFNVTDLAERKLWSDYQYAFEDMIRNTSTEHAPWIIVPSNHKWYRNYVVGKTVVRTLEDMKLRYPPGPKGVDFSKIRIQ